jgi:hypothetical protein
MRRDAELLRDRVGEIDLEADQVIRVAGILEDERSPALRVRAPPKLAALADGGQRIARRVVGRGCCVVCPPSASA